MVRGKNVVDWANTSYTNQNNATTTRSDAEYSVTCGSSQFGYAFFSQDNLKLKPNTDYVFRAKIKSTTNTSGSRIRVNSLMTSTNTEIYSSLTTAGNIASITFKTPSTIPSGAGVGLYPYAVDKNAVFTDIMICEGIDTNTSYLPYNTLEVVERGINLLDKTQVVGNNTTTTVTQINTGFRVSAETLGYAGVTTIDVKANTNYFLKFNTNVIVDSGAQKYVRIFAGTTQTTTIATYTFTEGEGTFNTGNNTKINIWFYCSLGGSGTVDYTNVQLQEGSTASSYEPYITPITKQLSLGEYEFAKIGNYVDTIEYDVDEDKAYKNKAINKYQFIGNENFGKAASTNLNGYIFNFPSVTTNILAPANNGIKANILSNAFITKAVDTIISEATYGIGIRSDKYLYIGAPLGSFENVSALQTYLANNPTFMYYVLATAVKEEITGTLKDQIKDIYNLKSYIGTTILEVDGDLPLIIKTRALKGE